MKELSEYFQTIAPPINTIVTSCNKNYLWGVFLLVASIRLNGGKCPIIIWAFDFTEQDSALLCQFSDVTIYKSDNPNTHLDKPRAILSAETEYVTWVDADCMFLGNLDSLLIPPNRGMHIRFRALNENAQVFQSRYSDTDQKGSIPESILAKWQEDVNEESQKHITTQCVSNFISLHRRHFPFIKKWQVQIEKSTKNSTRPVDKNNQAYFMTDESVLASLFAYAHDRPNTSDYKLNEFSHKKLIHFGESLKPWKIWRYRHLKHYHYVIGVIDELKIQGVCLPAIPKSLDYRFKLSTFAQSFVATTFLSFKRSLGQLFYSLRPNS
jgi:hypothetical protein